MEFSHVPVLFEQTMEGLNVRPGKTYADGTLGGGGHASGILERMKGEGLFIGIDRDQDAIDAASERLKAYPADKQFVRSNYADIKQVLMQLGVPGVDGAVLDLGVSSFQLDNPERGFSYMQDAPLDMRMDQGASFTAEDVVNGYDERELVRIIREYSEEHFASQIARAIVRERAKGRITATAQLTEIIKSAIPPKFRREGPHPAKRTFQAIRIEVNGELDYLESAVTDFIDVLNPGGRLAIISFHSLEDRIVKNIFAKRLNPCTCPPDFPVCVCGKVADVKKVTGKPIEASEKELEENPRARSAKLRIIEKK